jgi:CBS domain-containing protein
MKAKDIMTTPVISVGPDTPLNEIAKLLFDRRISGSRAALESGAFWP